MSTGTHTHQVIVRFGDCDPAGIVYFPRFFDWFHQTMESWFDHALGLPYAVVIGEWKLGFPAARTEADFKRPCRIGDVLDIELRVLELGSTSIHFAYTIRSATDATAPPRATGETVCVVVSLDETGSKHLKPVRPPKGLQKRIELFLGAPSGA